MCYLHGSYELVIVCIFTLLCRQECARCYRNHQLAIDNPNEYLSLIVDEMDQNKTNTPSLVSFLNGQIRESTEKTFPKLRATAKLSVAQTNHLLAYTLGEAKKERKQRNEQRQKHRMDMHQQAQQKGKRPKRE